MDMKEFECQVKIPFDEVEDDTESPEFYEKMLSAENSLFELNKDEVSWRDNADAEQIDKAIKKYAPDAYPNLVKRIVKISEKQLEEQSKSKITLKKIFTIFFVIFIGVQYIFLMFLLLGKAFWNINLSDNIIAVYIGSVFLETLGAIIVMVKYAFDSNQEVEILGILNNALATYQIKE